MKKIAVIVAGGSGQRMGAAIPKQFLTLHGKPLLWHSINAFVSAFNDIEIIVVLPKNHLEKQELINNISTNHNIHVVTGGETRFHSVKNGLSQVHGDAVIFVHDAVRCLVTTAIIERCYDTAIEKGNAIPAITAIDSMRQITADGNQIIDRNSLRVIQTPQTFLSHILLPAFEQPWHESFTDEASVVEKTGVAINLVEGATDNIKITTPVDLLIAEQILQSRLKI